jgi:hypothetical protein
MKRFIRITLACLVFVAATAPFAAHAVLAGSTPRSADHPPSLELRRALDLAEAYIAANRIDLSRQHLRSARLLYDEGEKRRGLYWHLQWAWASPAIGGEYGMRVYMDGTILPERLGP